MDVAWSAQPGPQQALVSCPIGDVLFGGARGGGKTDGLLGDWLGHVIRFRSHARGILFRRTYPELEEVETRAAEIYPLVGATWQAGRKTWAFPWGGALKLRYLEQDKDAGRYQGHSYTWAGVDEAGNFPSPDPIDKINGTLRSKYGVPVALRLTANPGGVGSEWLRKRYVDPAPPKTPFTDPTTGARRVFIPSRLQDNRILMRNDPGYVDRLRRTGAPWLVKAWLEGDWNATPDGGVVNPTWFRRYRTPPAREVIIKITQSWDCAQKAKEVNDYWVCTTWAETHQGYYLLDVYRERMEFPAGKRAVKSLAEQWGAHEILIEDASAGSSVIQELRAETVLPVIAVTPEGDKETRLVKVTPLMESGRVWLPESAPWLIPYEAELTAFPNVTHDDQADSTSQFLARVQRRFEILIG